MHRKGLAVGIILLFLVSIVPFIHGEPHDVTDEFAVNEDYYQYMTDWSVHLTNQKTNEENSGPFYHNAESSEMKPSPVSGPMGSSWPMFRHDLHHSGYSTSSAPTTNVTVWNYTTNDQIVSSPAVFNGKIYFGSKDHNVYCLNSATGVKIWQYNTNHLVCSSPAIYENMVYVGSNDLPGLNGNKLYCLNASTGALIWEYLVGDDYLMYGVYSSPAVVDGKVYVGAGDHKIYCFNAFTGEKLWEFFTGLEVGSSPAVANGKVYVGSQDGWVYCLNATTGGLHWNYPTQGQIRSSPTVVNGKVYIGSARMYCFDAETGFLLWNVQPDFLYSSPAVYDNKVYVCDSTNRIYCLNATFGWILWQYEINLGSEWGIWSSPAIADGKVYVGGCDGKVYCFDAETGEKIWEYRTGYEFFPVFSSPAIANERVYIGDNAGKMYCFGEVNNPPEKPTITGPTMGFTDVEYLFSTDAITDPDGDSLFCLWDWGDGTSSGWIGPFPSGQSISNSHSWAYADVYDIRLNLKDIYGLESNWSDAHTITIVWSEPLNPPNITGPHYGKINTFYTFTVGPITNPDGDQFYVFWNWGDENTSSWVGPFNSGASVNISYAWREPGNYTIKVKIKNIYGVESEWSSFLITIVQLKPAFFFGFFQSFNQTEDLFIIEGRTFIIFPSLSIFHKEKIIVISKGFLGHLGTSCILGVGDITTL